MHCANCLSGWSTFSLYHNLAANNAPNSAPAMVLMIGFEVRGHVPEAHFPKWPTAKPATAPIKAPIIIFIFLLLPKSTYQPFGPA